MKSRARTSQPEDDIPGEALDDDDEPEFVELEVALDSGAVIHVLDRYDAPHHEVVPSEGSKRGQYFVAANNARINNEGKVSLDLLVPGDGDKSSELTCDFQVAKVSRPLMSMSRVCDQGLQVLTDKDSAKVLDADGRVLARFDRRGGLYVAMVKVRNPRFKPKPKTQPFVGQGK